MLYVIADLINDHADTYTRVEGSDMDAALADYAQVLSDRIKGGSAWASTHASRLLENGEVTILIAPSADSTTYGTAALLHRARIATIRRTERTITETTVS